MRSDRTNPPPQVLQCRAQTIASSSSPLEVDVGGPRGLSKRTDHTSSLAVLSEKLRHPSGELQELRGSEALERQGLPAATRQLLPQSTQNVQ